MKKWLLWIIASCVVVLTACGTNQTEENSAAASKETKTVVAGTMVIVDILDKLGVDSVVGVPSSSTDMPTRYKDVKEIGNAMNPDMEIVKSLNPDVFVSVTTLQDDIEPTAKSVNINAEFVDLQGIPQLQQTIRDLGKQFNREQQAEQLAASYDKKLADVKKFAEGKKKPKVLAILGIPGSYLVATDYSYIGSLITATGGENAIQGPSEEYLASNTEYLQQSKPDIILRLAHGMPDEVMDMFDKEFKTNTVWKHFDAVKNDRVYDLSEPLFQTTANLQVDDALDYLQDIFYEGQ